MFYRLLSGKIKHILIVSIAVQLIGVCIFVVIFLRQRRLVENAVLDRFTAQVGYIEKEMSWSADCLTDLAGEMARFRLRSGVRELDWVNQIGELRRTFSILRTISGRQYQFFSYTEENGQFLEYTTVEMPFDVYRPIRNNLIARLKETAPAVWTLVHIDGRDVVYCLYHYAGFYLGAWITGDELLLSSNAEGGYSVRFIPREAGEAEATGWFPFEEKRVSYPLQAPTANFLVELTIPADRQFLGLSLLQLLQLLIWLQVLIILIWTVADVNRNLLKPARSLRDVLRKYQGQTDVPEQTVGETVHDAYEVVRTLGRQVDDLSAELMEKELKIRQVQLNFKNLQIRPHFIVNCFAMISGMAQVNDTESIKKVLVDLADYFRYILHDSMDMVTLEEEADHIRCLIHIREKISGHRISFETEIAPEAEGRLIPVLSLATLAENAIRCAGGDEQEIRLRLNAAVDDGVLRMTFTDNGPGMAEELMDEINEDSWQRESNGRHIGLNNLLERLKLIYNGLAEVRFSRDGGGYGGTRVEIGLPQDGKERTDEHG